MDMHKRIVAAFDGLNEEDLQRLVREGVTRAVTSRVRELVRYEFSKEIRDIIKGQREALMAEEQLTPEGLDGVIADALREVAAEHVRELVLRALK